MVILSVCVDAALARKNWWCDQGDSNPHGLPHSILSAACLPIPPWSHLGDILTSWDLFFNLFYDKIILDNNTKGKG